MKNPRRPKVLIVTYFYPPINVTGALRPLSFAKYLPKYGYDVQILTTARHGSNEDENPFNIMRGFEPYGYFIAPLRNLLMRNVPASKRSTARVLSSESVLSRIQNRLLIPDQAVTWFPFATILAAYRAKHSPFDIVLSTSPPESPHLVAFLLKKMCKVPWIADFRDGWLFEPLKPAGCYQGVQGSILKYLESSVVKNADGIIGVTSPIAQDFSIRYPDCANKVSVIPNGYDKEEMDQVVRSRTDDNLFKITYTGALSLSRPGRSVSFFLEAIASLVQNNESEIANHLRVSFVGDFLPEEQLQVNGMGLEHWVTFSNSVPRQEAIQMQKDSDVLLLITEPNRKGVATAKLFDYIGAYRPILALAKGDTAGEIVNSLGCGCVVDRENVDEIRGAIMQLYDRWRSGSLDLDGDPPEEYERCFQAGVLAGMFDDLLKINRGTGIHGHS